MRSLACVLVFCLSGCDASRSVVGQSVPEAISSLNDGASEKLRVSAVLVGLGLVEEWSPQAERQILLDSEVTFGECNRTFRCSAQGETQHITLIGVGDSQAVAGGDFPVDEMRVGETGAGPEAEAKYLWNGAAYQPK